MTDCKDIEDIMECICYMIVLLKDGKLWTDRVYKDDNIAKKRVNYLNKLSDGRGEWFIIRSEFNSQMNND